MRRTCSACGADLVVRRQRRTVSRRGWFVAGGGVVLVLVVLVGVIVPALDRTADREAAKSKARQDKLEAAERQRLTREGKPRFLDGPRRRDGEAPLDHRARLVATAQTAILADARERIATGELKGPFKGTSCEPYPITQPRKDAERDASVPAGRYECIAFTQRVELMELNGKERTGVVGTPYWLVIDYRRAKLTFCKITPKAGEGGKLLAEVAVPDVCQDPLRDPY